MAASPPDRHSHFVRPLPLLLPLPAIAISALGCETTTAPGAPDAGRTLDVPLVHLFDDDYGTLIYARALDGEVLGGARLDEPEPALDRATSISAGGFPSISIMGSPPTAWECASLPTGEVLCTGSNVDGELGSIPTDSCYNGCDHPPESRTGCNESNCVQLFGPGCYPCVADWSQLPGVMGLRQVHHACGVDFAGKVVCWGHGHAASFPGPVRRLAGDFAILESGDLYPMTGGSHPILTHVVQATTDDYFGGTSCAITDDTSLYCWGANDDGQLGDGTTTPRETPVLIGSGYQHVVTRVNATCAIRADRSVVCWGAVYPYSPGSTGNCGIGDTCALVPTVVAGLSNVKEIAGLVGQLYALRYDGSVVEVGWPPEAPTFKTMHAAE